MYTILINFILPTIIKQTIFQIFIKYEWMALASQ